MSDRVVTLTGPPGSGKSTAARAAAATLGLEYLSAGTFFREDANRRGMDLDAFSRYAEEHPEVDRLLDERMLAAASPARLLEGRITGALLRRRGVPILYLVVTAREEVRVARIAGRDGLTSTEALRLTRAREASEEARYRALYSIDLDRETADLTVDSSELSPEQVADRLVQFVRTHRPGRA